MLQNMKGYEVQTGKEKAGKLLEFLKKKKTPVQDNVTTSLNKGVAASFSSSAW